MLIFHEFQTEETNVFVWSPNISAKAGTSLLMCWQIEIWLGIFIQIGFPAVFTWSLIERDG